MMGSEAMTELKILRNEDRTVLEESVNEHLSQGWVPSGSLTVLEVESETGQLQSRSFIQPMHRID